MGMKFTQTISCHFSFTGSIRVPELFDVCINHIQQIENQPGIRAGALTAVGRLSNARLRHGVDLSEEGTRSGELRAHPRGSRAGMGMLAQQGQEGSQAATPAVPSPCPSLPAQRAAELPGHGGLPAALQTPALPGWDCTGPFLG